MRFLILRVAAIDPLIRGLKDPTIGTYTKDTNIVAAIDPLIRGLKVWHRQVIDTSVSKGCSD